MRPGKRAKNLLVILLLLLTVLDLVGFGIMLGFGSLLGYMGAAVIGAIGVGLTLVFGLLAIAAPDKMESMATERILNNASTTLGYVRNGLTEEGCRHVCETLLRETRAHAVAITNRERVLAYVGELEPEFPPGSPIRTQATKEVLESGHAQTFSTITPAQLDSMDSMDVAERLKQVSFLPSGIVAPLTVRDTVVGAIKFYYENFRSIDRTERALAQGFAELLSTQLAISELDRQARLTSQAEVRALQAQINPHFLFNTINTIAALIRRDPARARELLREFAVFYRKVLESSESLIPLSQELEQTSRYLDFEYARFGRDRIHVSQTFEEGLDGVPVPAFIVQPIVENAVRHAMREEGTLHIEIQASRDGSDLLISVADDGCGMDEEQLNYLREEASGEIPPTPEGEGTGTAVRNVWERLSRQYGPGSGLAISSRPEAGTVVLLRLVGALVPPTPVSAP